MRIVRAELHQLDIPFRFAVSHARKRRRASDAMVVCLQSESGTRGYGETLARPYVTGETRESCFALLETRLAPSTLGLSLPASVETPSELFRWIHDALSEALVPGDSEGVLGLNAARAAMELALVDLWLRERGLPLAALLPPKRKVVTYSGVIPASGRRRARALAGAYRLLGISSVKIKIKSGGADDAGRLCAVRRVLGPRASLRVDANGDLSIDEAMALGAPLAAVGIEAFEQPTPRNETRLWERIARKSTIPLMPDESLVTAADARGLLALPFPKIFNLRLAKLGGIYPTLRIAALSERYGVPYQIGCLVGETAVLSAAGRAVAAHLDPRWVEGSFGSWLLRADVSETPVRFGFGGRAETFSSPGLGVAVSEKRLARYRARRVVMERS